MPQEEFQFSECYELLKYSRNQSNYDKINRCIIENDLSRIIKYIKSELNLIQGKSFSRFSGPDSGLKLTVYIFRAFKIGDYFIMPLILTIFLLLSIGLLLPVIVMPESNSQYLWLIIALIILTICIIVSYSIIFTDRYIFIPLYKKALYFFPVIAFPFEVVLPYFVCMVVSVAVYLLLLVLIYLGRNKDLIDISEVTQEKTSGKYRMINDFISDNSYETKLFDDKGVKTFAIFERYELKAVYICKKCTKGYKLDKIISGNSYDNMTEEDKKEIIKRFKNQKISIDKDCFITNCSETQQLPHNQ